MGDSRKPLIQKIRWVCEKCGASDVLDYEPKPDTGIDWLNREINDQHYQINRFCLWDVGKIRIYHVSIPNVKEKEK